MIIRCQNILKIVNFLNLILSLNIERILYNITLQINCNIAIYRIAEILILKSAMFCNIVNYNYFAIRILQHHL